jgi:hypothetical protein
MALGTFPDEVMPKPGAGRGRVEQMSDAVSFRRARGGDLLPAYRLFRRSIFAYLHRVGLATAEEAADPPVESSWKRQADRMEHFWSTAAENWVAEDE